MTEKLFVLKHSKITKNRLGFNLTREALAERINIDPEYVRNAEVFRPVPSTIATKLAEFFNVPLEEITMAEFPAPIPYTKDIYCLHSCPDCEDPENCPGWCSHCGQLYELVRPGKSQPTCSCSPRILVHPRGTDHEITPRQSINEVQEHFDRVRRQIDELEELIARTRNLEKRSEDLAEKAEGMLKK